MSYLKRLGAAVVVTLVVAVAASADCPVPGIMNGPPCVSAAQTAPDDPTAPGIMQGPPASNSVDLISIAEIALNSLLLF